MPVKILELPYRIKYIVLYEFEHPMDIHMVSDHKVSSSSVEVAFKDKRVVYSGLKPRNLPFTNRIRPAAWKTAIRTSYHVPAIEN